MSPDGERIQCECCPREDVSRLDNVVRAVQGTMAAASALPELVGDEGSLQPVEYFVSRETFVALEQAVGGRLELDPSRGGRPASMAKLGTQTDNPGLAEGRVDHTDPGSETTRVLSIEQVHTHLLATDVRHAALT